MIVHASLGLQQLGPYFIRDGTSGGWLLGLELGTVLDERTAERWLTSLPLADQAYLRTIRHEGRRQQSLMARMALCQLHEYLGLPYMGYRYEQGAGQVFPCISVSHTGWCVWVVLSGIPIGIDCEGYDAVRFERLAPRFLSEDERKAIDPVDYGAAWAAKEAAYKALGIRGVDWRMGIRLGAPEQVAGGSHCLRFLVRFVPETGSLAGNSKVLVWHLRGYYLAICLRERG